MQFGQRYAPPVDPPVNEEGSVGSFQDAATNGLWYKASPSGKTGYTQELENSDGDRVSGGFEFEEGDAVEFRLGGPDGLLLGNAPAELLMMPQDIASPEAALNIAQLLLSINVNAGEDLIEIPGSFKELDTDTNPDKISALTAIDLINGPSLKELQAIDDEIAELVEKDMVEEHLSKTTSDVIIEKTKDDPAAGAFDPYGKIMRTDSILLKAGSNCYLDLTAEDLAVELERTFGKQIKKEGHDDGEEIGKLEYAGSNDRFNDCKLDPAGEQAEDEFKAYEDDLETVKADLLIKAGELQGFVRKENLDEELTEDGSYELIPGEMHTVDGVAYPVGDGEINDQRDVFRYSKTAQVIMNVKDRFPMQERGQLFYDPVDGTKVWFRNYNHRSTFVDFKYEVSSSDEERFIDLTGEWEVRGIAEKTDICPKQFWTGSFSFKADGTGTEEEFYERKDDNNDCELEPKTSTKTLEEHARGDSWYLAYNEAPKATLTQLNSRVMWRDEDEYPEYVRWSYMPEGEDWNQGVIYRYKENSSGEVLFTEVYRRKQPSE